MSRKNKKPNKGEAIDEDIIIEEESKTPNQEVVVEEVNEVEKEHIPSDDEVYDEKLEKKEKEKAKKKERKFNKVKAPLSAEEAKKKKRKKIIIAIVILVILLAGAGAAVYFIFFFNQKPAETAVEEPEPEPEAPKYYSKLTGLQIANEEENTLPTYCIQVPNGLDGARPQVGIDEAGVIFEAIAEAGITRFAAVFQNPKSAAIGPIRSLRIYYLDWDTPFDCTVVHAGGSLEAVQALAIGGYRDLTESYTYMWRDYTSYWAPNNLMTSPALLAQFNNDNGYKTSNPSTLPRLLPDEAKDLATEARKKAGLNEDPTAPAEENSNNSENSETEPIVPLVKDITVNFGGTPEFNTIYNYDDKSNTYLRSYATGEPHLVYSCTDAAKEEPSPKSDCGLAKQLAPSAVAVMMVDEYRDSDGYHEAINTLGTGIAYIFQNGTATRGTWRKETKSAQIVFQDSENNTISFTPGQLWIAAVPNSTGSVKY